MQFAYAILPLFEDSKALEEILQQSSSQYDERWNAMMASKLGLQMYHEQTDHDLISALLQLMEEVETDMTIFFRKLAQVTFDDPAIDLQHLSTAYYSWESVSNDYQGRLLDWLQQYRQRFLVEGATNEERRERMNRGQSKVRLAKLSRSISD